MNTDSPTTLLRAPQVLQRTALKKTTFFALVKSGQFPAPFRIADRAVAWRAAEVDQWIASRTRCTP
jgi:prophage regulatory protein